MTATPDKPVVRETPPGGSLAGTGNRLRRRTITAVVAVISVALIAVLIRTLRESETIASRNACIQNLRVIEGAKDDLALHLGLKDGDKITPEQLSPYIHGGWPALKCFSGGVYSINPLGSNASCCFPTHAIPK